MVYNWQHSVPLIKRKPGAFRSGASFAELPDPLQRLRPALLRHEGGDKVMPLVLMAVPTHGVDAMLVAVELVLESRPSADYAPNVIARLTEGPSAPSVATALMVGTAPLADPHRHDALRDDDEETTQADLLADLTRLRLYGMAGCSADGLEHGEHVLRIAIGYEALCHQLAVSRLLLLFTHGRDFAVDVAERTQRAGRVSGSGAYIVER